MRICFFSDARNVHVQRLTAGLAGRGHEVHLVCHKPKEIEGVTIEPYCIPPASLQRPFRWTSRQRRYLTRFLRRFDAVVLYFLHDFGFTAEMLSEGRFIASPRGSDVVAPPGEIPPSPELVERRIDLLNHAAVVGVSCPRFAKIVGAFAGLDPARMGLLPLGVDLEAFRPERFNVLPGSSGLRVGFFKGFREVYGAADFVSAMPAILAKVPSTQFDLVGDGPQLERCQALAMQCGVHQVIHWLPRRPHREVPELLAQWDVSVMPSYCESFGLAALESAAMGIPVVASNVGGLPDTVQDEETGLLVPPGSPSDLATAVVRLLQDEPLRRRLSMQGRHWVAANYAWDLVLDQWERILRACMKSSLMMRPIV